MTPQQKYLDIVDEVIAKGPFKPDWVSLSDYETVNSVYLFTGGCSVYRHSIMSGIPEICTSRVWRSGSITEILLESIRSLVTRISFRCLQHRSSSRRSG